MFKSYLKVTWRNILRNKIYSFINITGLAAGLATGILIGLWIWDEISFDRYHKNHSQIAQVMATGDGGNKASTNIAIPLGDELRNSFKHDFKYVTLASRNLEYVVAANEKKINTVGIAAQPQLPVMLTLKMVQGRPNALEDPSSVLISASLAKILFGKKEALNQIIKISNNMDLKVAGIFEDLPHNTKLNEVKFIVPWDRYVAIDEEAKFNLNRWGNHSWQLFVQMNDPKSIEKINKQIRGIPMRHLSANEGKDEIFLHPMNSWHLYNEFSNYRGVGGRIRFLWLFGTIGIFVLLLACINFVNLATARSEKRSKEVGIRKAIGSLRLQLIHQFLIESVLMTMIALIISIGFAWLALPSFNNLAAKEIQFPFTNYLFWILLVGFTISTGIISGIYPAFYLSKFKPIKVLKGSFRIGRFAALPRKTLVVIQFTVSIILIICTIVIYRQIKHGRNRQVGYDRNGLISVMMNTPELKDHYQAIRNELISSGAAEEMAVSSSPSTDIWSNLIGFDWKGKDPATVPSFGTIAVSHDFGKTIGWKLKEGRDFSRDFPTDSGAFILNEAAVQLTGFKNPIGEMINWEGQDRRIIGVVKDLVMESPYATIKPTIFFLEYGWARVISIKLRKGMPVMEALSTVESVFKKYNPASPFDFHFADQQYAEKFAMEQRIGNLSTVFAMLAIFISCLGLFGLASFVAEQRTKEIGVRKVLGASTFYLWKLLAKDFLVLTAIACLIAIPLSWQFLQQWLQQYSYRTFPSWWIFILTSLGALAITLMTVSYQAIKAASTNPVKSIRTE